MKSEDLWTLLESLLVGPCFWLDRDARIVHMNDTGRAYIEDIWGRSPSLGDSMTEFSVPELLETFLHKLARAFEGHPHHEALTIPYPNGQRIDYIIHYVPIRLSDAPAEGVLFWAEDRTEARALGTEHRLFARALQELDVGVSLSLAAGDEPIVYVNDAFERLTGYASEEVLGRNLRLLQGEDRVQPERFEIREWLDVREPVQVNIQNYRKDGTPFVNHLKITPIRSPEGQVTHFVGVQEDITAALELERRLLHDRKMNALGRLSAEIAHDFNNVLTILTTQIQYARVMQDEPRDLDESFTAMQGALDHAAALVRQLLDFARHRKELTRTVELNARLEHLEPMLAAVFNAGVDVHVDYAAEGIHLRMVPDELEQIVVNIADNASDALGTAGGHFRVAARLVPPPEGAPRDQELWCELDFCDSGDGVPEALRDALFEPYYTTKSAREGTGLGLSIVARIVRRHAGFVRCEEAPGGGARFRVWLPVHAVRPRTKTRTRDALLSTREPASAGRVMLVEPDPQTRRRLCQILLTRHHEVFASADLDEACAMIGALHQVDVLIAPLRHVDSLDALLHAARRAHPGCRVTLVGASDAPALQALAHHEFRVVTKPYSLADLLGADEADAQAPAGVPG